MKNRLNDLRDLLTDQADSNGLVRLSEEFNSKVFRLYSGDQAAMAKATAQLRAEGFYSPDDDGLLLRKDPGRQVRRPSMQNEHAWCIMNIRGLNASERTVAFYLHYLCYADGGDREATKDYLSYKTELSPSTVSRSVKRLINVGLFDRLDNGKGGRNNANRAKYRPMVPAWWIGNA